MIWFEPEPNQSTKLFKTIFDYLTLNANQNHDPEDRRLECATSNALTTHQTCD